MSYDPFCPFRDFDSEDSDVDFDDIAEDLGLTRTQKVLLLRLLGEMEISFWFAEKDDTPTLEVRTFWGDEGSISAADLIDILEREFKSRKIIGDEKEITALNRLKTVIDAAISEREKTPS